MAFCNYSQKPIFGNRVKFLKKLKNIKNYFFCGHGSLNLPRVHSSTCTSPAHIHLFKRYMGGVVVVGSVETPCLVVNLIEPLSRDL